MGSNVVRHRFTLSLRLQRFSQRMRRYLHHFLRLPKEVLLELTKWMAVILKPLLDFIAGSENDGKTEMSSNVLDEKRGRIKAE